MKDAELKHFKALSDVFLNAIKQQNYTLTTTISRFFYDAFKKEREASKDSPVVYPAAYYELVYKTIEELAILTNKKNAVLENRSAGSIWLLGELQDYEISDTTYVWLWRNLSLAIKYDQDDMLLYHWETAHQYYAFNLRPIQPDYDYEKGELEVKNQNVVEKRERERRKFLEFHYTLGGLLTYKKRFKCMRRIFDYTTSQPPRYELLPESMYEVFYFYNHLRDPYDRRYSWISNKYPFPDLDGVKSDAIIKKWVSSYSAILFLRQYTIQPYLITMKPLEYPNLPKSQAEKKEWIDSLDFFKHLVTETLNNHELLEALNFKFITRKWCGKNNKAYPLDFIDIFKEKLNAAYESGAKNLEIDEQKVSRFYKSTSSILEDKIDTLQNLMSKEKIDDNYNNWFLNGQRMVQSKDAFAESSEVHHIDFDSFLVTVLANRIDESVSSTFMLNRSKAYLFKQELLFDAVKELSIDQSFVILNFGINLSYYFNFHKVVGLSAEKYNDIDIISLPSSRLVEHSLFVIKKTDLPNILLHDIDKEIIEKYSLEKISESKSIYASVIDLNNTSEEIKKENSQDRTEADLTKSVLLSIIISMEIRWNKEIALVQLSEYSEYRQKGLPNKLSDIKK